MRKHWMMFLMCQNNLPIMMNYKTQQQRTQAIDALLKLRAKQMPISSKVIQKIRQTGRP